MKLRKASIYFASTMASFILASCAGTAPNAAQKGFQPASLNAKQNIECEKTDNIDACARNRDLYAVNPLEDDGFHDTKIHEAREAKRDQKRQERGD